MLSCHRWLVVLGDLERYHRAIPGLGEDERLRHRDAAIRCYNAALFLKPANGNPHNQLAVIASRDGNELEQLYHYCRSLACKDPFPTALENMRLVFKNNEEMFLAVQKNLQKKKFSKKKGRAATVRQESAQAPKLDKLSYFVVEFVRVHGILFMKDDVRELDTLRAAVLRDYEAVLKRDLVTELMLLQLHAVNLFSCNNAKWHPEVPARQGANANKPSPNVQRLALKFTVEFVHLTIAKAVRSQDSSKYLGSITAFFEWLVHHPQVCFPTRTHTQHTPHTPHTTNTHHTRTRSRSRLHGLTIEGGQGGKQALPTLLDSPLEECVPTVHERGRVEIHQSRWAPISPWHVMIDS